MKTTLPPPPPPFEGVPRDQHGQGAVLPRPGNSRQHIRQQPERQVGQEH